MSEGAVIVDFFRFKSMQKEKHLIHGVTKRVENLPCDFSMALHTGEAVDKIMSNRKKLEEYFYKKNVHHFVLAEQTHSDHVFHVTEAQMRGWYGMEDAIADTDALICNIPGVMIGILTADCVPVLLFDPVEKVTATVHAGWRGTQKKIVAKTVKRIQEDYGSLPSNIIAGIGPSIGGCCYEVGEEVAKYFQEAYPDAVVQRNEKYRLDLPTVNRMQLEEMGVSDSQIEMSDLCTSCENEAFFSYRKECECSGRFLAFIGIGK
jgi:YfiH family protein